MKATNLIIGISFLNIALLHSQTVDKPATVRIKRIENINGVEKVTDTTFTTNSPAKLKLDEGNVDIQEWPDKDGNMQKVVIVNDNMGSPAISIENDDRAQGSTITLNSAGDSKGNKVMKKVIMNDPEAKSGESIMVINVGGNMSAEEEKEFMDKAKASGDKKATVRIKTIETINGVEKVSDSTYTTSDLKDLKAADGIIKVTGNDQAGKMKKVIAITRGNGAQADAKAWSEAEVDKEIETALKNAGVDPDKHGQCIQKMVIADTDDAKTNDGKSGKKVTRITITKKVMITDATAEDLKLVSKQTGITDNQLNAENMSFYPNPNSGKFNLRFTLGSKGNTSVNIMNTEGKQVYSENLKDFSGTYDKEIDISKNPRGIYFVKIEQGSHSQLKKIVLE